MGIQERKKDIKHLHDRAEAEISIRQALGEIDAWLELQFGFGASLTSSLGVLRPPSPLWSTRKTTAPFI